MYEKCEECGCKRFVFVRRGVELKFGYVRCWSCHRGVTADTIILPFESLNFSSLTKDEPWELVKEGFVSEGFGGKYSIHYRSGMDCGGPKCIFHLPQILSDLLGNQFDRGYLHAKDEMRKKLGL